MGTGICFGCGKYGHKVRDFPRIALKKEGKKIEPSCQKEDAPTMRRFYALRTRGKNPCESDDGCMFFLSCCDMISFYVGEYGL